MIDKGIILAGGSGKRLHPVSLATSKQLIPIYNKPMIYYPLSTLMQAGIRRILIITTPTEQDSFLRLLGDGSKWGVKLEYAVQTNPGGIAEAFIVGESFIDEDASALILGDNIFHGQGFSAELRRVREENEGATVFACRVENPKQYGVVELDSSGKAKSIEEKPLIPKSNLAVTGLYFYDSKAVEYAKRLTPSKRGELEITDLNNLYLEKKNLKVVCFDRGFAWLDTGSSASMLRASNFVEAVEVRQGRMIACPEEIAFEQGWIGSGDILELSKELEQTEYGRYLRSLLH